MSIISFLFGILFTLLMIVIFPQLTTYKEVVYKEIEVGQKQYSYRLGMLNIFLSNTRKIFEDYLTKEPYDDEKLVNLVERFERQEQEIKLLIGNENSDLLETEG